MAGLLMPLWVPGIRQVLQVLQCGFCEFWCNCEWTIRLPGPTSSRVGGLMRRRSAYQQSALIDSRRRHGQARVHLLKYHWRVDMDLTRNNILLLWLEKYSREFEKKTTNGNKVTKNRCFELGDVFPCVYNVAFDCVLSKRTECRTGHYNT